MQHFRDDENSRDTHTRNPSRNPSVATTAWESSVPCSVLLLNVRNAIIDVFLEGEYVDKKIQRVYISALSLSLSLSLPFVARCRR